jgi:hypothetical protein
MNPLRGFILVSRSAKREKNNGVAGVHKPFDYVHAGAMMMTIFFYRRVAENAQGRAEKILRRFSARSASPR